MISFVVVDKDLLTNKFGTLGLLQKYHFKGAYPETFSGWRVLGCFGVEGLWIKGLQLQGLTG